MVVWTLQRTQSLMQVRLVLFVLSSSLLFFIVNSTESIPDCGWLCDAASAGLQLCGRSVGSVGRACMPATSYLCVGRRAGCGPSRGKLCLTCMPARCNDSSCVCRWRAGRRPSVISAPRSRRRARRRKRVATWWRGRGRLGRNAQGAVSTAEPAVQLSQQRRLTAESAATYALGLPMGRD